MFPLLQGGHPLLLGTRALIGGGQTRRSPLLVHLQQAGWRTHSDQPGGQATGQRLGQQQRRGADLHRGRDDGHPGANGTGRAERQRRHRPIGIRGLGQRMFTKTFSISPPHHVSVSRSFLSKQTSSFMKLNSTAYAISYVTTWRSLFLCLISMLIFVTSVLYVRYLIFSICCVSSNHPGLYLHLNDNTML